MFKAIKITDRVYWVGVRDWSLRNFHGYTTHKGSTYNAYLILGEKVILVDTCKKQYKNELLSRISSVVDPKEIDYIISNHSEMDHSGALPEVVELVKPEKLFASPMGVKNLKDQLHWDVQVQAVKDGEEISFGDVKVQFFETRMLHWPDSMFSWLPEERVLFSQDAFAMHLSCSELFADEVDQGLVWRETATYYANILLPYSNLILKLLEKVRKIGLNPTIVATDHGPIWRREEDIARVLSLYERWAKQEPTMKAVVLYDTMWGSTDLMGRAIADGLIKGGCSVKITPLSGSDRSDVATEVLDAGALIAGSPTLNNNLLPSVADVLTYLKGLRPQNLVGAAFGSYGWSGESVKQVKEYLEAMKVDVVGEAKVKYVPTQEDLSLCFDLGTQVAAKLKELTGN